MKDHVLMDENKVRVPWKGKDVEGVRLKFKTKEEDWNHYETEDGSTVKMKTVVSDIIRLLKEHKEDGEPIYLIKSTNIVETVAPDELIAKSTGSKEVN